MIFINLYKNFVKFLKYYFRDWESEMWVRLKNFLSYIVIVFLEFWFLISKGNFFISIREIFIFIG